MSRTIPRKIDSGFAIELARVRAYYRSLGSTPYAISQQLAINHQVIYHLLDPTRRPTRKTLARLADNIPPDWQPSAAED